MDFKFPLEWIAWALGERHEWTERDVESVAARFIDHWHSKAGRDGRKADWQACWRNWVRVERRHWQSPRTHRDAERAKVAAQIFGTSPREVIDLQSDGEVIVPENSCAPRGARQSID